MENRPRSSRARRTTDMKQTTRIVQCGSFLGVCQALELLILCGDILGKGVALLVGDEAAGGPALAWGWREVTSGRRSSLACCWAASDGGGGPVSAVVAPGEVFGTDLAVPVGRVAPQPHAGGVAPGVDLLALHVNGERPACHLPAIAEDGHRHDHVIAWGRSTTAAASLPAFTTKALTAISRHSITRWWRAVATTPRSREPWTAH
jgi:hypothetical protein